MGDREMFSPDELVPVVGDTDTIVVTWPLSGVAVDSIGCNSTMIIYLSEIFNLIKDSFHLK